MTFTPANRETGRYLDFGLGELLALAAPVHHRLLDRGEEGADPGGDRTGLPLVVARSGGRLVLLADPGLDGDRGVGGVDRVLGRGCVLRGFGVASKSERLF